MRMRYLIEHRDGSISVKECQTVSFSRGEWGFWGEGDMDVEFMPDVSLDFDKEGARPSHGDVVSVQRLDSMTDMRARLDPGWVIETVLRGE